MFPRQKSGSHKKVIGGKMKLNQTWSKKFQCSLLIFQTSILEPVQMRVMIRLLKVILGKIAHPRLRKLRSSAACLVQ